MSRQFIGSVVGIGGMAGAIAGMLFAQLISRVLQLTNNNFMVPFAIASVSYVLALGVIHWLLPNLEKMSLEKEITDPK